MEKAYHRAIEDKTMLEQELIGKVQVEEEVQRLKDELNGPFTLDEDSCGPHPPCLC